MAALTAKFGNFIFLGILEYNGTSIFIYLDQKLVASN